MPDTDIVPEEPVALASLSAVDQHPVAVYLASLAPGSRRTMRNALGIIAELASDGTHSELTFPWAALRYQHTAAIRAALQERYAPATANKMLVALRRVLKEAQRLGQLSNDEYAAAVDYKPISGDGPMAAAGRALDGGELRALLEACAEDIGPAGVRDAAIIAIAYACGLRRAEIVALDIASYNHTTGSLTIHGKRRKVRVVPLERGATDALQAWLQVRGVTPGPLFVRIRRGGHIGTERLTDQAVYHIEATRAKQAGVAHFSPHDIRRTFAGDLLDAGVDISTVQSLMGHANTNTTARYDRRGERAKRAATDRLNVPYQKK
jgi:integrase/recombinase XerD